MNETIKTPISGPLAFVVLLALLPVEYWLFVEFVSETLPSELVIALVVLSTALITALAGFYTLQPNESRVLILFGKYKGTVKKPGWHWGNPFYSNSSPTSNLQNEIDSQVKTGRSATAKKPDARFKISLRARTEVGATIKVNDKRGNPIEIAAVVVWRVSETAKAVFDVDDYRTYVKTQIETALRHVATGFSYDHSESGELSGELTLRGNPEEVAVELRKDLESRLSKAGVTIDDARLTHLAYAPEIAQAMLRRQQADAVISARRKIVQGAVGMVELALAELERNGSVSLDDDRKASMVSNLMVVLCSEREASPVINAGTLYN